MDSMGGSSQPPDNTPLVLSASCSSLYVFMGYDPPPTPYVFTSDNLLMHASSGKCIQPLGGEAPTYNTPLVLTGDCNSSNPQNLMVFVPQADGMDKSLGTLRHVSSGFCVRPLGLQLFGGSPLVFWPSCIDIAGSPLLFRGLQGE